MKIPFDIKDGCICGHSWKCHDLQGFIINNDVDHSKTPFAETLQESHTMKCNMCNASTTHHMEIENES